MDKVVIPDGDIAQGAKALYDKPVSGFAIGITYIDGTGFTMFAGDLASLVASINKLEETFMEKSTEAIGEHIRKGLFG